MNDKRAHPLKRAWNYVWHGESIGSLLISIVLVFLIVRFILYPLGGALIGTSFPVVAVVSSSMEHVNPDAGFFDKRISTEEWWNQECCTNRFCTENQAQSALYANYNITLESMKNYRFPNGFNKGDIMILSSAKNAEIGDTIVFFSNRRPEPIIHRLIAKNPDTWTTKGDNNCAIADFEESIPLENIQGRAIARIPWLGYIKIVFVEFLAAIGIGNGI